MKLGIDHEIVVAVVVCVLVSLGFCQSEDAVDRGCYLDGDDIQSDRVMRDLIVCDDGGGVCQMSCGPEERYCESPTGMTIEFCHTLCRSKNFQYYGLQGGDQCFCGGAFATPFEFGDVVEDTLNNCSEPCTGDRSQKCGGEFLLRIFEYEDPVVTPGCFFPGAVPYAVVASVSVAEGATLSFACEPGYQLVGESMFTCLANRTWSSNALPVCNYTGVFPEPTTEMPTTTMSATTTANPTTEEPSTAVPLETTTQDVRTTDQPTATSHISSPEPEPTTKTPARPTTTVGFVSTKPRTTPTDYLPYIIGGAAALLILLLIVLVCALTCKLRKRSGNANQDIILKPDDLAPVTLLNRGFNPGDDPEAGMPDIVLASGSRPQAVDNVYVDHSRPSDQEMSTFASGKSEGSVDSDDQFWKDLNTGYEAMKPLPAVEPNPVYEDAGGSPLNTPDGSGEQAAGADEGVEAVASFYESMDSGKSDSTENTATADDGDPKMDRYQRTSVATRL